MKQKKKVPVKSKKQVQKRLTKPIKKVKPKKATQAPQKLPQPSKIQHSDGLDGHERSYVFDERLVPYFLGAATREINLKLRQALIKLGRTKEMTELFASMELGNLGYDPDAKETFMRALFAVINGHDQVSLLYISEEDIQAIHDNNLKTFDDHWKAALEDDLALFRN